MRAAALSACAALVAFQPLRWRSPRRRAAFLPGLSHPGGTSLAGFSRRASSGRVHAVSRWASPSSSARSSSAIWCRKWGRTPPSIPTPYGVGIGPETASDLRPRQPRLLLEQLQPLEGSREARRRLFCRGQLALSALSGPSAGRKPQAGRRAERKLPPAVSPVPEPWGRPPLGLPKGCGGPPHLLSMCAGFFRCPLPARIADGQHQLVGQLSAVSRADGSLALAVLATRYGASGMSMWNQRDRSLVPCSLMALMR